MPAIEADEELRRRGMEQPLGHERLYDLILTATGDSEQADRVAADYLMSELRSGQKPVM